MEESGAYVFLTHEANAAIYRRRSLFPATQPDGWTGVDLPKFKMAGLIGNSRKQIRPAPATGPAFCFSVISAQIGEHGVRRCINL